MKTIRDKRDYGCWILSPFMFGVFALILWASINTFSQNILALVIINVVWFGFTVIFVWPGPFISRVVIVDGNEAIYKMKYLAIIIKSEKVNANELREEEVLENGMTGTTKVKYLVCGNSRVRVS